MFLAAGGGGGGDPGSSSSNPITDFSAWKVGKTTADDGKYWVKLSSGTNTAFETYITLRNGGWMKVAQMWSDYNVITGGGGAADNAQQAGGAWINNEINTSGYGKLHSSDIDAMDKSAYLMRVTGGSDSFLNSGAGTMKFEYTGNRSLGNWGSHHRPTGGHRISVDHSSTGEYDTSCYYIADTRSLCRDDGNHSGNNGSAWTSDHNYNGDWLMLNPAQGVEQCYTFTPSRIHTNLHGFGGGTYSGSNQQWGHNSTTAVSWWLRPTLNSSTYDSTLPAGTVFACNGDSFTDDSVYGHKITAYGPASIDTSVKKTGSGSVRLTGAGNGCFYVKDQMLLDDDKSQWQFQAWVRMDDVQTTQCIVDQYNYHSSSQTGGVGGRLIFGPQGGYIVAREGGTIWLQGTTSLSTNTWYHIMLNWDGSTHRLFVDGNLEDSGNPVGNNSDGKLQKSTVTGFGGGFHLSTYDVYGYMDHTCVQWNTSVKTSNFTPNASGYTT